MADETATIDDWIFATLTGDDAMRALIGDRVFPDLAPTGTEAPYVVYSILSGQDTNTVGQERVCLRTVYQIRAFGNGQAALRQITGGADRLMHGTKLYLDDMALKCVRRGVGRAGNLENNARYDSRIALFGITAQPDDGN